MEAKPIAEMSDDEIIEELKRLRARREAKREAGRTRKQGTGPRPRKGALEIDEDLESAFEDDLDDDLESALEDDSDEIEEVKQ